MSSTNRTPTIIDYRYGHKHSCRIRRISRSVNIVLCTLYTRVVLFKEGSWTRSRGSGRLISPILFFLLTMNLVRLDWRIIAVDLMTNLWACDVCDAPWSVARDTRVFPPGGASVGRHKPTTSVWRIAFVTWPRQPVNTHRYETVSVIK